MILRKLFLVMSFFTLVATSPLTKANSVYKRCKQLNEERLEKLVHLNNSIEKEKIEMLEAFDKLTHKQESLLKSLNQFLKKQTNLITLIQFYKRAYEEGTYSDQEIDDLFVEDMTKGLEQTLYEFGKEKLDQFVVMWAKKNLEWNKFHLSPFYDSFYDYTQEAVKAKLIEEVKQLPSIRFNDSIDFSPFRFFIGFSIKNGNINLSFKTFFRNRFSRDSALSLMNLVMPITSETQISQSIALLSHDKIWIHKRNELSIENLPGVCQQFKW